LLTKLNLRTTAFVAQASDARIHEYLNRSATKFEVI